MEKFAPKKEDPIALTLVLTYATQESVLLATMKGRLLIVNAERARECLNVAKKDCFFNAEKNAKKF